VIARSLDTAHRCAHLSRAVKSTTATWLSGLRRAGSPTFRLTTALARRSHGRLAMLSGLALGCPVFATGCLVAEAPEYGPAQQRPATIDFQSVTPSLYNVIVFDDNIPKPINVPVRSEDAGDKLQGTLWVDWESLTQTPILIWDEPVPASSFDDVSRSWSQSIGPDPGVTRGCGHTLTLLLMHESNYDFNLAKPKDNAPSWDVASVTWQINMFPKDPAVIEPCPQEGLIP
jgi:hypothetical protein